MRYGVIGKIMMKKQMSNSNIKTSAVFISCAFILLALLSMVPQVLNYNEAHMYVQLPEGYEMYRIPYGVVIENKRDPVKFYPEKFKIGPNVGGYHVYENLFVGLIIVHPRDKEGQATLSWRFNERRLGHFIVDLHTRKVYGGLNTQDWMRKLKIYGITEEPKLHKPSWLDEYTGWNRPSK